jgi:hypothetical protein
MRVEAWLGAVGGALPWKLDMKRLRSGTGIQWPTRAYMAGQVKPWKRGGKADVTCVSTGLLAQV